MRRLISQIEVNKDILKGDLIQIIENDLFVALAKEMQKTLQIKETDYNEKSRLTVETYLFTKEELIEVVQGLRLIKAYLPLQKQELADNLFELISQSK